MYDGKNYSGLAGTAAEQSNGPFSGGLRSRYLLEGKPLIYIKMVPSVCHVLSIFYCCHPVEHYLYNALLKRHIIPSRELAALSRCGRTDRGVHALGQVVAFRACRS